MHLAGATAQLEDVSRRPYTEDWYGRKNWLCRDYGKSSDPVATVPSHLPCKLQSDQDRKATSHDLPPSGIEVSKENKLFLFGNTADGCIILDLKV